MRSIWFILSAFLCVCKLGSQTENAMFNGSERQFRLSGYFKELPSLDYNTFTSRVNFNNTLQNRINFSYIHNSNLLFAVEARNRLISGNMVTAYGDLLEDMLEKDRGLVDASFVPFSNDNMIWHSMFDRFYADWKMNNWQVRVGRQRINWGINMVSNPNDLFNNYSFFDIDYEERPGADALRIQHYTGDLSRFELAVSPGRNKKNTVAAMLYAFNTQGYDVQFVAGYYRQKTAIGAGWAGHISASGFKGEATLFNNINHPDSMSLVAAISFDHLFANGLYGFVEMLYNGGHKGNPGNILMLTEPMSADNIFISKYAITGSLMYPLSPLFSASLAGMYMPDLNSFYVSPNLTYAVLSNLDIALLAQYFRFNVEPDLEQLSVYLQVKWSF